MNKSELIKKCNEIILKTNGGNDDYVVALCQISMAIKELDEPKTEECEFIEEQEKIYSNDPDDYRYYIHTTFTCDNCGFKIDDNPYCDTCRIHNFCPNCGRKIKKGE